MPYGFVLDIKCRYAYMGIEPHSMPLKRCLVFSPPCLHLALLMLQACDNQRNGNLFPTDSDVEKVVVAFEGPGKSSTADTVDDEVNAPRTC